MNSVEALCYGLSGRAGDDYYYNVTEASDPVGILVYRAVFGSNPDGMDYTPSTFNLQTLPTSDLAPMMIYPGQGPLATFFSFDEAGKLYLPSSYDESSFRAGERPVETPSRLYRWEACYNLVGTYYYPSLNWAVGATGTPQNPTCSPVNVTKASAA